MRKLMKSKSRYGLKHKWTRDKHEETDEIKIEIQRGTLLLWNRGKKIAEVKLVLMPAFRDKF